MTLPTALLSCSVLGLQHGIDVDHVAAISDVTSIQRTSVDAARSGMLYALGHATTVGVLGIAMIVLQHSLSASFSYWMQRIVGLTLVILGIYILGNLLGGVRPMGRGQAILAIIDHIGGLRKRGPLPPRGYGPRSSLSLGVLHGIGAETPTQLSVLLIAANLGGLQNGVLALTVFASAMFISNMVLTAAAMGVFAASRGWPQVFRSLGAITAGYSIWIGIRLITS